jgi:hypothetical protein
LFVSAKALKENVSGVCGEVVYVRVINCGASFVKIKVETSGSSHPDAAAAHSTV